MTQPPERKDDAAPDQRLVRALDHPVRVSLLKLLAERRRITASEALPQLNREELALSNVAYHASVLEHLELIEVAEEPGQRDVAFQATAKGEAALMALGFSS